MTVPFGLSNDGSVVRFQPPRLSAGDVACANAIATARTPLRCQIAGEDVEIALLPLSALAEARVRWLAAGDETGDLSIFMPETAFARLMERLLPGEDLSGVATDVQLALFEEAVEPLLLEIEKLTLQSTHLTRLELRDIQSARLGIAALVSSATVGRAMVALTVGERDFDRLLPLVDRFFPRTPAHPDVPLRVALRFGFTALPLADVRQLQPGDALVLDAHLLNERRAALVVEEKLAAPCVIDGDLRLLTEPLVPAEGTRLHGWCGTPAAAESDDTLRAAGEATIRLDFDGWSGALPVGAIVPLAVGEQIGITGTLDTRVLIKVNGRIIGAGEVLQLGERFAVRIDHLRVAG